MSLETTRRRLPVPPAIQAKIVPLLHGVDLEPGVYWTRSTDPQYPGIGIAEWTGEHWCHIGVSATSRPGEVEAVSVRLIEPGKARD